MTQAKPRTEIFNSDIDSLQRRVFQNRLKQAGILLTSVGLPLSAMLTPNQSIDMKLWELGLGSLTGLASMFVARERKDLEARYQAFLDLQKEHEKGSIKSEFGFHSATQHIRGELNLATAINRLESGNARIRYANKFAIPELIALPPSEETDKETASNEPQWLDSPFQYTPISKLKPGEEAATPEWIIKIVEEAIRPYDKRNHQHLIINAPTQQGKSTLAACFIGLFCKALNGKVTTLVIDPKHSDTNWLVPVDFGGFEQAYNGLKTAIRELDDRKRQAKAAKDKGLPKPDFNRYLIILDEWNILYGQGKGYAQIIDKDMAEQMLADVQRILNESAFLNMTLILIGQSPLSGDNGLSRPIMENATRITLTKTAIRWLNDKDFPNPELKTPFRKKLNGWLRDGRRCAMVMPMSGEPYCALIPIIRLDYFTQEFDKAFQPVEVSNDETPTQPHQESSQNFVEPSQKKLNLLEMITTWYTEIMFEFGHEPNDATLQAAWQKLTNQELSNEAIAFLRNRIRENFKNRTDYHN